MDSQKFNPIEVLANYVEDEATVASEKAFSDASPIGQSPNVVVAYQEGENIPELVTGSEILSGDQDILEITLNNGTMVPIRLNDGNQPIAAEEAPKLIPSTTRHSTTVPTTTTAPATTSPFPTIPPQIR